MLLLDEIGAGLTDAEAGELVTTIKGLRERGVAIVWIEHIVHVLVQVVDRLVCMDAGRVIADGDPREVMATRRWSTLTSGAPREPCSRSRASTSATGSCRRCATCSSLWQRARRLALVGANGAGKTTLLRAIAGAHPATAGRIVFDGQTSPT